MSHLKAHEVDAYLNKPDFRHRVFLVYGPDKGLVHENAALLAQKTGADLNDPFSTIKMDANEAASDKSAVADEAHTVSMFGGMRLVWISGNTQKNLALSIQPVLDQPPEDAIVIIEAGDLKKTAPLRSRIEKSPHGMALPCYQDQGRALDRIITQELQNHNLKIDNQTQNYLKTLLGDDRMASRSEINKLCLYVGSDGTITHQDIQAVVGDASVLDMDTLIDAAFLGDIATMEHMYKRLIARGTAVFQVVNGVQRHCQMLHQARQKMQFEKKTPQNIIATLRPPVHFQRRDKISSSLALWTAPTLERMLQRLEVLTLETRKNAALAIPLTATTLLAMALEAKRLKR